MARDKASTANCTTAEGKSSTANCTIAVGQGHGAYEWQAVDHLGHLGHAYGASDTLDTWDRPTSGQAPPQLSGAQLPRRLVSVAPRPGFSCSRKSSQGDGLRRLAVSYLLSRSTEPPRRRPRHEHTRR